MADLRARYRRSKQPNLKWNWRINHERKEGRQEISVGIPGPISCILFDLMIAFKAQDCANNIAWVVAVQCPEAGDCFNLFVKL